MTIAETFAEFAADITLARLPDDVVAAVRRRTLDLIGCMLASAADGSAAPVVDAVHAWAGSRETGVAGYDFRAPAPQAAFANGTLAGALVHDAVHVPSLAPLDAAVIPAALAVAEEAGRDGASLLEAIAIGSEIAARIAVAEGTVALPAGAAAAAARLWGLSERETAAAIALAATSATPASEHRARLRRGWAAMTGVIAADLARRGVAADAGVPALDVPLRDAGERWEMRSVAIKRYPAGLWLHAPMDAAAGLGLKAGDIDEVLCALPPGAAAVVCEPRGEKIRPVTDDEARFSLPFGVATAIVGGRSPSEMFSEDARTDRRVLALAARVGYEENAALDPTGARVRIMLRDGRTRDAAQQACDGSPARELSDEDLRAKFTANARRRLDQPATAKLATQIMRLEDLDTIDEIVALAQGDG
ncbi:MAG TPA: MmgE/PrpD family protein [Actinomycetota bacterium]|nr:MmgE/PrpD family protein [Actinomycetota bacterium]